MKRFDWQLRVYWEDTDGGGVVYYANYLKFLERARSEWLRALGYHQQQLHTELGIVFAVTAISVNYLQPARLDDELVVRSTIVSVGGASMDVSQQIDRTSATALTLLTASVKLVCLTAQGFKPARMPARLRQELS
jgi:acyl-CoA thioester hydrolase